MRQQPRHFGRKKQREKKAKGRERERGDFLCSSSNTLAAINRRAHRVGAKGQRRAAGLSAVPTMSDCDLFLRGKRVVMYLIDIYRRPAHSQCKIDLITYVYER